MRELAHLRLVKGPPMTDGPAPTDDALMALAAQDDQAAFVSLVRRYERRIRSFCRLLLRDEVQAHDMAQEVFLKVWEKRRAYRPGGRMKEYLFTIARHHCQSAARKRAVRAWLGLDEVPEEQLQRPPDAVSALEEAQTMALVSAALHRLPEKFRVPLALRFVEGMPYEEIAQVIGRTPSAARSRVFYGLRSLAALLPAEVLG
ncbi:MAG TPA: sigma-70 family RNA polymerase sigma factor [Myxococcales bacterium]|nr:sigma-70 family RNA polymerase sigma factor [Myxococcales bacterium]